MLHDTETLLKNLKESKPEILETMKTIGEVIDLASENEDLQEVLGAYTDLICKVMEIPALKKLQDQHEDRMADKIANRIQTNEIVDELTKEKPRVQQLNQEKQA